MLHTFIVATAVFTSPPPLSFSPIPDRLAPFGTVFAKHIDVFGTHVFATRATPDAKVTHAAAVLAQWLDNNEDGVPDSPEVAAAMAGRDAYLFMTADEREMNRLHYQVEKTLAPWGLLQWGQFLHGSETNPGDGRFDAAIEETLHLVCTAGWAQVWPDIFGPRPGTAISNCCDAARGGRFAGPPRRYPAPPGSPTTTRRASMTAWSSSTSTGRSPRCSEANSPPAAAKRSSMSGGCSPEQVRARDAAVVTLLSDPAYELPTRLPDGDYGAGPQSDAFFSTRCRLPSRGRRARQGR